MDGSGAVALAEVLGAVAVAGGLSMGQPAEHGVRSAVLADRLAVAAGVGSRTAADAVAASLLRWSGCTANAAEFAALLGNDVDGRAALQVRGPAVLAAGQVARLGVEGPVLAWAHCEVAQRIAGRLGVGAGVVEALGQVFEQWNGQGAPAGLAGPALTPQTRLMTLAGDLEMTARLLGPAAARRQLWERSGRVYDPELALVADGVLPDLLEELDAVDPWDLLAATALGRRIGLQAVPVEAALTALADFADLKLPWTAGFSRSAARIAARAATATGGSDHDVVAGAVLVHGIGRVAVPNPVWELTRPFRRAEWEQVRLVPYHTERITAPHPGLADHGRLASFSYERLDGSGYHRGVTTALHPPAVRVVQAAVAWTAMRSPRPHRAALDPADTAVALRAEAAGGRLERAAVEAVLGVEGEVGAAPVVPSDLTRREAEVLRLLARGLSNGDIAAVLFVSPKTVGSHLERIYRKLDVHTRAAATLAAMERGFLTIA